MTSHLTRLFLYFPLFRFRWITGAALALFIGAPAWGQTLTTGALQIGVEGADGSPIAGALIQITGPLPPTPGHTDAAGSAGFRLLPPGTYQARIEAAGYRPVVVRSVAVVAGAVHRIRAELVAAPPPVVAVDTVFDARRAIVGAGWIPTASLLAALPDLGSDISDLAGLHSRFDPYLGGDALPGRETGLFVDGVPFTASAHPWLKGRSAGGLPFPRASLGQLRLVPDPLDIEWAGVAGPIVAAGTGGEDTHVTGLWSGSPVTAVDLTEPPPLRSLWFSGATRLTLVPDTSFLSFALDARQVQHILSPITSDSLAAALAAAAGVPALDESLSSPFVAERTTGAGTARLDWRLTATSLLLARASLATVDGVRAGPSAPPEPWTPHEQEPSGTGTDFSAMAQLLTDVSPTMTFEIRGGLSKSSREFGSAEPDEVGLPATLFVSPPIAAGATAGLAATVERRDLHGTAAIHMQARGARVKAGGQVALSSHESRQLAARDGFFLLGGEGPELTEGSYFFTPGPAPTASFDVMEYGGFAQLESEVVPGFDVVAGVRFDRETLPVSDFRLDENWVRASGMLAIADRTLDKASGRFGFTWDVASNQTTFLEGSIGSHYGRFDPSLLAEAVAGPIETRSFSGVTGWPDSPEGEVDDGARSSLLAGELQAPRTIRGRVALRQALGGQTHLTLGVGFRTTDFIPRRTDLNLVPIPSGRAPDGRELFGTPLAQGALLLAAPNSSRRFSDFDVVWGVVTDGWSRNRSFDALLEHSGPGAVELFAGYTLSETEDNWWGAASAQPEASLSPAVSSDRDWVEGTSDFDVRHRVAAGLRLGLPFASVSAVYRFRSGLPFTPGFRGVDANLDGSAWNDPAFVPDLPADLSTRWSCLEEAAGGVVTRNSCRGEGAHRVDVRLALRLFRMGGSALQLVVDGLDLAEGDRGVVDTALLLLDSEGDITRSGESVIIPYRINPGFGTTVKTGAGGRTLRIGLRLGSDR
jgi:hypothetical protein